VRARHIALVVVLVAIPVVVALLVGRSHTSAPAEGGGTLIGLNLKGGDAEIQARGCGIAHHYTAYASGATIHFRGNVTSAPRRGWKVKVKVKSCIGGRFEETGTLPVHVKHDDSFKGAFRAPVPGYYFVRASVNVGGRRIARSAKQFFRIR
jgi:hypothetical protein